MVLPTLLCVSCGQVYRPVVIPCSVSGIPGCPVEIPPIPANFHAVFALSTNAPNNPGGALQIDVSGDSIIAETPTSNASAPNLGAIPAHAAILPNNSRVFVATVGSVSGGLDGLSSFTPASQSSFSSGFGTVLSPTLPSQASSIASISEAGFLVTVTLNSPLTNVPVGYWIVISGVVIPGCTPPNCNPNAYNGGYTIASINGAGTTITYTDSVSGLPALSSVGTATFPPQPVFVNAAQNNTVYSANYNSNSVYALNTSVNAVTNSAPVGAHPVSLASTPNLTKLYVANQGDNINPNGSVSTLSVADLSPNTLTGLVAGFAGKNPVWVVARGDSQKVYVLTQGDGQLVTIDVATDTVTSSLPVGAGANFIFFDPVLNRLYVTNPLTNTLYVFSDTGGISPVTNTVSDIPVQLTAISFAVGSAQCPTGPSACSPISVTALKDGSRFYVASYQTASSCPDPVVGAASACVIPGLSVFDANSLSLKYPSTPILTLLTTPFAAGQYALPPVGSCVSPVLPALYTPGATRFRIFTTAAVDSSHVYVSMCDAGAVADIITTGSNTNNNGGGPIPPDTLITDLPTAYGVCTQASCSNDAPITAFSITSNIVTFQAANNFAAGQNVSISGLTTGTYLNGFTLTILATGLSNSQFECYFTYANVGATSDSGIAVPAVPLQTPVFMMPGQ
jgi:YVTN family beta-propeller protein